MAYLLYYPRFEKRARKWLCGYEAAISTDCLAYYKNNTVPEKELIPRTFGSSKCANSASIDSGPCPEIHRCNIIDRRRRRDNDDVKYSVSKDFLARGRVTRCISANLIPTWQRMGYQCGA